MNDTVTRYTETVITTGGPVRGLIKDGMRQFLAIPYAAAPVGRLRWMPPEAHVPWSETFDAVKFGNVCAQSNNCFPGFGYESEEEDCLYLSVVAPLEPGIYPVMFWIPGGGLFIGGMNGYDPGALVRDGRVVYVSLNYRLNVFGFFSHPSINAEGHASGNYGIMDQQFGLQWVKENITRFGGDPENVTIFGESAGGMSVWSHLSSPLSAGLFHKAIVQSGTSTPLMPTPTLVDREEVGIALANAAGCTHQSAGMLRAIPARDLLAANAVPSGSFGLGPFHVGLLADGQVIPEPMNRLFTTGRFNRVPVINGTCKNEYNWFQGMFELATGNVLTTENLPAAIETAFTHLDPRLLGGTVSSAALEGIKQRYAVSNFGGANEAYAAAIGDCGFICGGGRRVSRALKSFIEEIYAYEFDVPDSPVFFPAASFPYASAHTVELQYIFPDFAGGSGTSQPLDARQKKLSRLMVRYWSNFAHSGSPNEPDSPSLEWPLYDPATDNYIALKTPEVAVIENFGSGHHCDFWDKATR